MYFAVSFNGKDRVLYDFMIGFADKLPKYWHWNIIKVYTLEDVQGYVDDFVSIREANNLDI